MSKYIIVFVTCPSKKEAKNIAKRLLDEKLIACANVVENIESLFWWKCKIDKETESLIIAKTVRRNFSMIQRRVKGIHSYEVPEIIALPILEGAGDYLKWIDESVKT